MDYIKITDAYEHNLKHLDLEIPLNAFTCVTGCSGCGKSSLVFDTIYAESQRGMFYGITGNIFGQKMMNKPHVGSVENLRPALNISQNYYNFNPRSTIGTMTEISMSLRSLFALVNSNESEQIAENIFSSNNPKSYCPNCLGLGIELEVSKSLLMPDRDKTLRDGGILFFKGAAESKEQRTLEALCSYYGIDINKKISQLTASELNTLLNANDNIKYKLSYKEGKRRKQHFVNLNGAITSIKAYISQGDTAEQAQAYTKFMIEAPCHVCSGAKLRPEVLQYKVSGKNYAQIESMELKSLNDWLQHIECNELPPEKKAIVLQMASDIQQKIEHLIKLDLGYLSLNRTVPSLSDGERQRVRIASQISCPLQGLLYILDEPCKGLHYKDIDRIIDATNNLVARGNTVIAIEHNKRYISAANHVITLGPVGGPDGGYLLSPKESQIKLEPLSFKIQHQINSYFTLKDINFRNIQGQTASFPLGGISCITGVSGSGKSTLTHVVSHSISNHALDYCASIEGANSIKRVIFVNQAPIGKTPRSTIVSYLGIFDEIRALFSSTEVAKRLKLGAAMFSMNVKGGRCETCQGTGLQKIELNFLPSTYITCPECNGKRFKEQILSVTYKGKNIQEILETPIFCIMELFKDNKKIYSVLNSMNRLGLGYLRLGQMSMNLSGGEAQRIKLAKALGATSTGHNLYIFDEPTSGLNDIDIQKFANIILSLQEHNETIVIIEHNIKFIASVADYIIDFGLQSGSSGGKIVFQGSPQDAFKNQNSSLFKLEQLEF